MKNHIRIPGRREARWQLLADLREIDPTVDLHYLGEGVWALGAVRWNRNRYEQAGRILRDGHDRSTWMRRQWELALYGFARINSYRIQGEPDTRILNDLRVRDWRYRHQANQTFEQALARADGTAESDAREKMALNEMESRLVDSYGNFFRGRRSFDMGRSLR